MIGEFGVFGMYFPYLMLTSLLALAATRLISLLLAKKGLYRFIWHPALFEIALFLIVLWLFVTLFSFFRP